MVRPIMPTSTDEKEFFHYTIENIGDTKKIKNKSHKDTQGFNVVYLTMPTSTNDN